MSTLSLQILADANGLIKGLNQAQKSLDQFVKAAGGAGSAIGGPLNQALSAFTNLAKGGGLAAGVLAGALIATSSAALAMTLTAGKQAEQLEQLSTITDLGTDTLQEYEVMLNRANLTGGDLVQVMKHVSTSLDQARQGTGTAADRFRQLGIDIRTVTSTDDLIRKIAGSSAKFANGAEKAALMSDLLGKGWATFLKAFGGGTQAMDDATAASTRLGATLSGGQLEALAAMDDRVDDLTLAWTRFGQQLGSFVAPAVDFAARALSSLLSMASNALKELNTLGGIGSAADTRQKVPDFVDQSKVLERARSEADGKLKIMDAAFKREDSLARANLQNFQAYQSARSGLSLAVDVAVAREHAAALNQMTEFQLESFRRQIANLQTHVAQKSALFAKDEKGQADLAKFAQDHAVKIQDLEQQMVMTKINADTAKMSSTRTTNALINQLQLQPYEDAVLAAKALDDAQRTLYQSEAAMLGASDAARRVRMQLIDEEAALQRMRIEQTIAEETRKAQALQRLDLETDTKRRQAIQQFPSFFERQLQAVVASNAFSISQITTAWTSGIANSIVKGGDFVKAAWESTQVAIIQGGLNMAIQWAAQQGLMMLASQGAAVGTASVWAGAGAVMSSVFATVTASFATMFATLVGIVTSVGTFIMGVLGAIAQALSATVFGIPFAGAIVVGIALIAAALAATGNLGFKDGGIGDFGSGTQATLHGPEAIIPLNSRGADFLRNAMGGGEGQGQIIHTHVMLNGREIARAVSDEQFGSLRTMGVL